MEDCYSCFAENAIELPTSNVFVVNEFKEELGFDYLLVIENVLKSITSILPCPKAEKFECSIRLSTNQEVQKMNKEYRGKDAPTNVLSFEYDLEDDFEHEEDTDFVYIGDIIFAMPIVFGQAEEQLKTVENHFAHLVAHSILHLFGFDHINQHDQDKMEGLEIKILEKLNIENPYIIKEDA